MLPHIWKQAHKECFAAAAQFCNYLQFSGKIFKVQIQKSYCAYDVPKRSSWVERTHFKIQDVGICFLCLFLSVWVSPLRVLSCLPVCFCRSLLSASLLVLIMATCVSVSPPRPNVFKPVPSRLWCQTFVCV